MGTSGLVTVECRCGDLVVVSCRWACGCRAIFSLAICRRVSAHGPNADRARSSGGRYKRPAEEGKDQSELDPGMMYYFLSVVADISSSPYINASAIYFAPNTSYSPSYSANFNQTFPLFAPRAFR